MSRSLNMFEFQEMMKFVLEYNSPLARRVNRKIPCIKYVHPVFDLRDGKCFAVNFRGFGTDDKEFGSVNEERNLPYSMFQRIMSYLKGAPEGLMCWSLQDAKNQAKSKSLYDGIGIQVRQIWIENSEAPTGGSYIVVGEHFQCETGGLIQTWRNGKPVQPE